MTGPSPGFGAGEDQGPSSHVRGDSDIDSNEEDDPINLNLDHTVLDDEPPGHSQ